MCNIFSYRLTKFFSDYLPNQLGVSTNTITSYRDTFVQLLDYINKEKNIKINNITFDNITGEIVEEFLVFLEETKKISISTRNQRLSAIHSFFKYIQRKELSYYNLSNEILAIKNKKTPLAIVSYMSVEEIKFLFSLPNINDKNQFRELTILTILYESGCRIQELIDLKINNLRLTDTPTIELKGKGNKSRLTPISDDVSNILKKYLTQLNILDSTEPLFKNKYGSKFTRVGVQYIINKYIELGKKSNPEYFKNKITNHSFRHSKAMHLLEAGVNLIYIRDILGHSSVVTTEIYAKTNPNTKRRIIEANSNALNIDSRYNDKIKEDLLGWLKTNV